MKYNLKRCFSTVQSSSRENRTGCLLQVHPFKPLQDLRLSFLCDGVICVIDSFFFQTERNKEKMWNGCVWGWGVGGGGGGIYIILFILLFILYYYKMKEKKNVMREQKKTTVTVEN